VPYAGRFDGFHAVPASVSKTCLVRFDNNKYSVAASAVGRPVEIRAYAERIELRQDGRLVGEHDRCFGRDRTVFDPWHYVPVLARKPGALRNGAPFKDWVLPAALDRIRRKLASADDGGRQMVGILTAVLSDGLPAVSRAADLRRNRAHCRPLRGVLALVLQNHPDRPLADLGRKPVRRPACHGSSLSRVGASGKPGAVQSCSPTASWSQLAETTINGPQRCLHRLSDTPRRTGPLPWPKPSWARVRIRSRSSKSSVERPSGSNPTLGARA
jgi:hypothetical protein